MLGIAVIGLLIASVVGCYAASVTYIYDEQNRLIRAEYPDGTITDYYYDQLGNLRNKEPLDTTPPVTSASPAGGYYNGPQSVTLTCSDGPGSVCYNIYYSTDGSTPATVYTSPISITPTQTRKFFGTDLAGRQ